MAVQEIVPTWVGATAKQMARAVRRGDTSATRVVADHLDHIAVADKTLSAFRTLRSGEAIVEAEKVDEQEDLRNLPLAGVPVAVKENIAVAGLPTWNGSAAARSQVAQEDHEIVRRLRGAGAVVVGVTRMPELGIWALTDDETAITRNPWCVDRTPGVSSGGAAAAVASGMVPIAHGNDGFGSVRIPAA
ncbi:MAG: amidase, partial [Actinobacteria bacterium]